MLPRVKGPLLPRVAPVLRLVAVFGFAAFGHSAEVRVVVERRGEGSLLQFTGVPLPAANDAGRDAAFVVVDGRGDPNGGPLAVLHDGRVPQDPDEPGANFFFAAGTGGGTRDSRARSVLNSLTLCKGSRRFFGLKKYARM